MSPAKDHAAGPTAVAVSMNRAVQGMGVRRTAQTLLRLNQADGFDCQGCAWPDPSPEHRHTAEFCENGVKAATDEATQRRSGREFFAGHPIHELHGRTDWAPPRTRPRTPGTPPSDTSPPASSADRSPP